MRKILVDTDILGDVDDAVTLAYLANNLFFDIKGITTVHGNTELRANFSKKMMIALGKPDIPVALGEKYSMSTDEIWKYEYEGKGLIGDDEHYSLYGQASDLLYDKIKENANDITLLCIAPLTNIARLFQEHPNVEDLISEIYIMGDANLKKGVLSPSPDEHNMKVDLNAAKMVLESGVPTRIITKKDSMTVALYDSDFERIRATGKRWAEYIHINAQQFMKERAKNYCYMYDPLTAIAMANPELIQYERFGRILMSDGVDSKKVKEHLLETLGVKND